ncbi:MAG: DUF6404 family protein [Rhodobacterales bacterium]|nr:DUF6404 family protein [Rhodobacterales bacterium]
MPSSCRQKLAHALELAANAGISPAQSFPPFLRLLSKVGLPVRPLHFMSTVGLVAFLSIGLGLMFALFHWLATSIDVNAWALNKIRQLGLSGMVAGAIFIALLTAVFIRFQSLRADIPAWKDL